MDIYNISLAKNDLATYSDKELKSLAQYYGIKLPNNSDLCWVLALKILQGKTSKSTMPAYSTTDEEYPDDSTTDEEYPDDSTTDEYPDDSTTDEEYTADSTPDDDSPQLKPEIEVNAIVDAFFDKVPPNSVDNSPQKSDDSSYDIDSFNVCDAKHVDVSRCKNRSAATRLVKNYHATGDKWWKTGCESKMSSTELQHAIKDMDAVYKMRCDHAKNYCNGLDRTHYGALEKFSNKLEHCLKLYYNKNIKLPYKQWEPVKLEPIKKERVLKYFNNYRFSINMYFQSTAVKKVDYTYTKNPESQWTAVLTLPTGEKFVGIGKLKQLAAEDAAKQAFEFISTA